MVMMGWWAGVENMLGIVGCWGEVGTSADANVNASARCKIRIRLIVANTVIKEFRLGSFEALKDISPL